MPFNCQEEIFFLVKFQFLQFETRTVKYKILTGMIKIVVLRSAFNEIILISPNTKGEKVVFLTQQSVR